MNEAGLYDPDELGEGYDSDNNDDNASNSSYSLYDEPLDASANPSQMTNARFASKQIETLKYVRHLLRENKSLKLRLEIVEAELEKYEEFGPFYKAHRTNILPVNDKSTSALPQSYTPKPTIDSENRPLSGFDGKPDDIFCLKTPTSVSEKQMIEFRPDSSKKSIETNQSDIRQIVQIAKSDKACQSETSVTMTVKPDDGQLELKSKIKELQAQIEKLKVDHKKEINQLNSNVGDLSFKLKVATEKGENMDKNLQVTSDKLAEAERTVLKLLQENNELAKLKPKYEILGVENDQLYRELRQRKAELEDSNAKFLDLTKNLNENFRIISEQKASIGRLEAENERHVREKHIECESKINELKKTCSDLTERLDSKTQEVEKLHEVNESLEKNVERYKADMKNFNFKEFVSLKRELNSLKQERERHFANMVTTPPSNKIESQPVLPPIKDKEVLVKPKNPSFNFFNN